MQPFDILYMHFGISSIPCTIIDRAAFSGYFCRYSTDVRMARSSGVSGIMTAWRFSSDLMRERIGVYNLELSIPTVAKWASEHCCRLDSMGSYFILAVEVTSIRADNGLTFTTKSARWRFFLERRRIIATYCRLGHCCRNKYTFILLIPLPKHWSYNLVTALHVETF